MELEFPSELEWRSFEEYDWDGDDDFMQGMQSVRSIMRASASNSEPTEEELECKARLFFYSRKINKKATYDGYIKWKQNLTDNKQYTEANMVDGQGSEAQRYTDNQNSASGSIEGDDASSGQAQTSGDGSAPYPSSFAHIVELITQGKEVPGIRSVPNILLGEAAASRSGQQQRRKPWEGQA
ncbi:hypothetical protein V1511DRAFT_488687 [Dipodascopsis uninucleata]